MMRAAAVVTLFVMAGCVGGPYTPETAASLKDGTGYNTICAAIEDARAAGDQKSLDVLIAEYRRRNPRVSAKWIKMLREGKVAIGMPEKVAACSWNAYVVNETIGFGQHTKQYEALNSDFSHFFVNARTGRVDFIIAN